MNAKRRDGDGGVGVEVSANGRARAHGVRVRRRQALADIPPAAPAGMQASPGPVLDSGEHRARVEALARAPKILNRFVEVLKERGVVGEERAAKLVYLALTSRLLDQPVSVAVKGPSSGGKSYIVEQVLGFFPTTAFYALTAMSERAMAYSEEPLRHRTLVIYEAAGLTGDFASYLVRSLLSEGRLCYETVEKAKDGMRARRIEREGPTGLIVTTTALALHPENETRLLSVTVTDTPEQTQAILFALAAEQRAGPDLAAWRSLQSGLEGTEHRVVIPYADDLAALIPPVAVRLRRDFRAVLNLVRAHALLHNATRLRDNEGRVVATVEDYAVVRELVADIVAESVGATVSDTMRLTVRSVVALAAEQERPSAQADITVTAVAKRLHLDESSALRRVQAAVKAGYLRNLETGRGRSARLVVGSPLPDEQVLLPPAGLLERGCRVAAQTGGINKAHTGFEPGDAREPDLLPG